MIGVRELDLDLIPQLKSREVRAKRRVLSKTLEGSWTALLKGRGMEFAGFRRYEFGDDASRIDWGASLRANDTLVREFEEYKNVNVLFLLDVSDTMLFSSTKKLKAEYGAELVFNIALSVLDNGDSIGYAMFSDGVVAKEMPGIGRGLVYSMAAHFQNVQNYGGGKDFAKVVNTVNGMLKERALIVLVSDFISMGDGWERYVKMLSEKFDLIGVMLRDPRDRYFPESGSQFLLEDPFSGDRLYIDVKQYREIFHKAVQEEESYVKGVFSAAKAGFVPISTGEEDMFKPLMAYLRRRSAIVRG